MPTFQIAVIPGDGVGREVTPAAVEVLQHAGRKFGAQFAFTEYDWSADYYVRHGRMMPADALDLLRPFEPSCSAPSDIPTSRTTSH